MIARVTVTGEDGLFAVTREGYYLPRQHIARIDNFVPDFVAVAERFVEAATSWLHVDIYGWTPSAKPARPEGGECQAARAIYKLLGERYG